MKNCVITDYFNLQIHNNILQEIKFRSQFYSSGYPFVYILTPNMYYPFHSTVPENFYIIYYPTAEPRVGSTLHKSIGIKTSPFYPLPAGVLYQQDIWRLAEKMRCYWLAMRSLGLRRRSFAAFSSKAPLAGHPFYIIRTSFTFPSCDCGNRRKKFSDYSYAKLSDDLDKFLQQYGKTAPY